MENTMDYTPGGIHTSGNPPASAAGARILEAPTITQVSQLYERERILEETGVAIAISSSPVSEKRFPVSEDLSCVVSSAAARPPKEAGKSKSVARRERRKRLAKLMREKSSCGSAGPSAPVSSKRPRSAEVTPTEATESSVGTGAPKLSRSRGKRRRTVAESGTPPCPAAGANGRATTPQGTSSVLAPANVAGKGSAEPRPYRRLDKKSSTAVCPAKSSSVADGELDLRPSTSKGAAKPSYSEKAAGPRPVAVIGKLGPDHQLTDAEIKFCKSRLMRQVVASGPEANAKGYETKDGTIRVTCASLANFEWIRTVVNNVPPMGNTRFAVYREESVPLRKAICWIPDPDLSTADVLSCLRAQNPGISTGLWQVLSYTKSKNREGKEGVALVVRVDEASVDVMGSRYGNRLSLFFGTVSFHVFPK